MFLMGEIVISRKYGEGRVIAFDEEKANITVEFSAGKKYYTYPGAFENGLDVTNETLRKELDRLIEEDKNKKQKEKEMSIKRVLETLDHPARPERNSSDGEKLRNVRKKEAEYGIVFKCNYCDGGCESAQESIGYCGVCSDENIRYNIDVKKRTYCCSDESPCKKYYKDGSISRQELEQIYTGDAVCYESRLLEDWKMGAGVNHKKGPKKGQVRAFKGVENNSLCVFSTLTPDSKSEADRIIFGVGLVGEIHPGDSGLKVEGFLIVDPRYRITFTIDEAKRFLLWDYHKNDKNPAQARWGTGLYRHLTKTESAQLLKAVVDIKKGTADEEVAKSILEAFCSNNDIDPGTIGEPSGALRNS